jgi:hypothetical protein
MVGLVKPFGAPSICSRPASPGEVFEGEGVFTDVLSVVCPTVGEMAAAGSGGRGWPSSCFGWERR